MTNRIGAAGYVALALSQISLASECVWVELCVAREAIYGID